MITKEKREALINMLIDYCDDEGCTFRSLDGKCDDNGHFYIDDRYYEIKWTDVKSIYDTFKNISDFIENSKESPTIYLTTARGSKTWYETEYWMHLREQMENTHYAARARVRNIKDVIFNPPATIILWMDGTKTVVKAQNGEPYDPEKGFAMAVTKKHFGNEGNYYTEVKKWLDRYKKKLQKQRETEGILCKLTLPDLGPAIKNMDRLKEAFNVKNQKLDLCYKFDNNTKAILDEAGREQINKKLNDLDTITKAIDICHNDYSCDGCPYESEELCLDHDFYSKTVDYLKEYKDLLKKEIGE